MAATDCKYYIVEDTTKTIHLIGAVISLIGLVLNYFCFLAADCLPESSSATLVKYLAVWDSLAAIQDGIIYLGLPTFGIDVSKTHVS